jgi:hypothetical protein
MTAVGGVEPPAISTWSWADVQRAYEIVNSIARRWGVLISVIKL